MSSAASYLGLLVAEGKTDPPRAVALLASWLESRVPHLAGWAVDPKLTLVRLSSDESDAVFVDLRGLDELSPYTCVKEIPKLFRAEFGPRSGYVGSVGSGDAGMLRKLNRVIKRRFRNQLLPFQFVLWLRDDDGEGRAVSARQARDEFDHPSLPFVLGYAHQCGEAWSICGYEAVDQGERRSLAEVTALLAGDPRALAHTLTHKDVPKGAKDIAGRLITSGEREAICLKRALQAPYHRAFERVGLRAFLEELETRLGPLFTG